LERTLEPECTAATDEPVAESIAITDLRAGSGGGGAGGARRLLPSANAPPAGVLTSDVQHYAVSCQTAYAYW